MMNKLAKVLALYSNYNSGFSESIQYVKNRNVISISTHYNSCIISIHKPFCN